MGDVEIVRATSLSPEAVSQFTAIYEASFPEPERDDVRSLLSGIAAGRRTCYLALDGSAVTGLAVLVTLPRSSVRYLEYLAVSPPARSLGIGGRFMNRLRAELAAPDAGAVAPPGIVWEVEVPDEVGGDERELRRRRIEFYLRHGAGLVDCAPEYRAPSLSGAGPLRFLLMWLPGPAGPARLEGRPLSGIAGEILTWGYGLEARDPLVTSVLAGLSC
jgi:GNAT superfamily N-acetyltransferase